MSAQRNPAATGRWLANLRVLDLSEGIAGPFCAKLLGDLGADVVKVEAPAGDAARAFGPFPDGVTDAELSAAFFYLNTSKRGVTIDLDDADGRQQLAALVRRFDIVISSQTSESLAARGLGFDVLRTWNPHVILTTVSGFGSFGPRSNWHSSHLVACAAGGWAQLCGTPDRQPLQAGGHITDTLTGAYAAVATSLAAFGRSRHGGGEHVDVSQLEAVLCGAHLPTLNFEYRGVVPQRYSSVGSGAGANFMLPTCDGYVGLNALTLAQWHLLCGFLGRADIAENPYFAGITWANPDGRLEEIRAAFLTALDGRSAAQLFHQAQAQRVPFGLVPDLAGLFAFPPHVERGFFAALEHPRAGSVAVPGLPFHSTAPRPQLSAPPLLGEHNDELLGAQDQPAAAGPDVTTVPPGSQPLPLRGVRVLDLSMFFAGPVAAQICADAGAEVIKVESLQRIDGWRGSATNAATEVPTWETSPYFNWVNRNKRDVTLNLKDPRGAAIIRQLVAEADVLIENYTPRVMAGFGLGWDTLSAINPRLVMISLSGFGASSSWRDYVAFGMSTEQMSGVAHLTGYAGGEPLFTGMTGGDLFAGVMGAHVLLGALHDRDLSGAGQHIDFSQVEACNLYVGDVMTGWSLAGVDPGRAGNQHPQYAPQGIYPCAGERWIGITCVADEHWQPLADCLGLTAAASDPRFATAEDRRVQHALLDEMIAKASAACDAFDLASRLQARGVAASAVTTGPDLLADPQLAARGMFLAQDRPGLGIKHYPGQPYRMRNAAAPPNVRAPLLGEHSVEVLEALAGLDSDAIAELIIADVTGTEPLAAR